MWEVTPNGPFNPRPTSIESTYLTLVSTQAVPARSENLLKTNEDLSKIHSYEEKLTPVDFYQTSSGSWVAQTLVIENETNFWGRILNIPYEDIVI